MDNYTLTTLNFHNTHCLICFFVFSDSCHYIYHIPAGFVNIQTVTVKVYCIQTLTNTAGGCKHKFVCDFTHN